MALFLAAIWRDSVSFLKFIIIIISIIIKVQLVSFPHQDYLMVFYLSEWRQVSSGLQDSSQYFGQYEQWCSLDGLGASSDF